MKRPDRRTLCLAVLASLASTLAACGDGDDSPRGHLDSVTQTAAVTKAEIDASVAASPGLTGLIGATSKCDVNQHRLDYDTVAPQGGAHATAGLFVPSTCPGPYPIVVYHHGTTVLESYAMSNPQNTEAGLQMAMLAAQGYVVVMPDYLGYGGSSLDWHPYLNAENTAAVSIDALRAAKEALADMSVATSGKLFLTGYSQGGHAALATHRAIERDHAGEFAVTASAPMSGPYSLSDTMLAGLEDPGQATTLFTPMILVGMQRAYGDVYARPEDVFQSPWVVGIENLLPGPLTTSELITQGRLPLALTGSGGLLTDGFVSAFKADPNFPARRRAAQQDLIDWKPAAPVLLCGGSRDPVVTFQNTVTAARSFAAKGATVTPVDVEQAPQFAQAIAAQVQAAPDLTTYHGSIVPPLCLSVIKNQLFDPLR